MSGLYIYAARSVKAAQPLSVPTAIAWSRKAVAL